MSRAQRTHEICLEVGAKRTFASAVDWPGWSRSARGEEGALQALLDYGPRYAAALRRSREKLGFAEPAALSGLVVVERVRGDATTDFGAPSMEAKSDRRPMDEAEIARQAAILRACWAALEAAARAAEGKELRKGPRGGGRELHAIVRHVLDAEAGYLRRIGRSHRSRPGEQSAAERRRIRGEVVEGIGSLARGEPMPEPRRSGAHWTPRYMARRVAWHALDHAWEIQDRASS